MTSPTTDPFGTPGPPVRVPDRGDPFGVPSDSGRAIRTGDAEDRAEVPRDQWDRYLMPHLDGTKPAHNKGFTRVSTTKAALSNTVGIQKWSGRRIIAGLAMDDAAVSAAKAASAIVDDKAREQAFGRIADGAFKTGGGKERSGLGTEFHELAELKWRGQLNTEAVDPKWNTDLAALEQLLTENDITPLAGYLERQVLCPYNQAGTFDLMARVWNPDTEEYELLMGDVKTGRKLDLGWLEILIQLWNYANAYALWTTTKVVRGDPAKPEKITDIEGFYEDMPRELRTDKAFILHVPLDGTAALYILDISGVERWVKAAVEAKRANAEAKTKVTQVARVAPAAFVAPSGAVVPWAVETGNGADRPQPGISALTAALERIKNGEPAEHLTRGPAEQADAYARQTISPEFADALAAGLTVETHTRTPQMLADAAKADERRAVAAQVLAGAHGIDPQTVASVRIESSHGDQETGREIAPAGVAQPTHDPVTGRKKRTCGHCHQPGHTQKNCPQNPASAKYNPQVVRANDPTPEPAGDPAPPVVADPIPGPITLSDQEHAPFCLVQHPHACQWTSQHSAARGQWVCSVSGKPGRAAYEAGTTSVTGTPPLYGSPAEIGEPVTLATDAPVNPAGLAATGWPSAPPSLLDLIAQAPTQSAVLALRQQHLAAGTWTPEHDAAGMARYQTLQP